MLQSRVRVRATARHDGEEASFPAPRSVLRQAIDDARAVLVSRDPARNGRWKAGLYLAFGVPVAHLAVAAGLLAMREPALRSLVEHRSAGTVAVLVALLTTLPLVVPWLTTFGLSAAFYAVQDRK